MILPEADGFCDCVMLGILETFESVYKCYGPSRCGGLLVGCCQLLLVMVCRAEE